MQVLRTREKHDDQLLDASTPEKLGEAALRLLTKREKEGWYYDPDVKETEREIAEAKLMLSVATEDRSKAELERRLSRLERELKDEMNYAAWFEEMKRVVAEQDAGVLPVGKRIGHSWVLYGANTKSGRADPVAWQLLHFRRDCEYEYVELTEVR